MSSFGKVYVRRERYSFLEPARRWAWWHSGCPDLGGMRGYSSQPAALTAALGHLGRCIATR